MVRTNLIQANVFVPPMFMAHEPQIPAMDLEGNASEIKQPDTLVLT